MRVGLETMLSTSESVEDSSDGDFRPVVTARKRKSIDNTPQSGLQKRLKGKGKATDSEVTTTDETIMFNKITLDNYDIEYSSDNFDAPVVKRPFLSESTKSAFYVTKSTSAAVESSTTAFKTSLTSLKPSKPVPIAFKSAVTSVKSSFYPMPVDKASDIKEGPKKISKRVMTIKMTVKNIWKPAYLQALHDLVHTTNLLVTHTFAFTKYIYLQELAANENFALNNFVTKDFFVEVFLSLVLSKGGNNTRLKDMTKNYTRLISKYKEAYFEDSGYTSPPQLTICSANNPVRVYPEDYTFQENSIYYDVMASPESHFKAFFRLAELSKAEQTKQFALDLNKKAFKYQRFQEPLQFQGTLKTDGVGVSIIKQDTDTSKKSPKPNTEKKVDGNQTEHIEGLGQADLKSTEGKCVLIDPGRRDLMYCMKETSTVEEKQTLIFTKNNRSKFEAILSRSESNSVSLKKFVQYTKKRASVKTTLYEYYGNETTKTKETYFPESEFDFRVDQNSQQYAIYLQTMLQQKHISARLDDSEKSKFVVLAKEMYRRPQQINYKETISTALEKLQLLSFRKLKFSSELFFDQNDQKLVCSLKAKFGQDAVLVFGNWSAPNVKYREPTRNKGLIRMLKMNRFVVYLINKYKTSSHCPTSENELEKFKNVPNPHPYQRKKNPDVLCNGLLRYKSLSCLKQQTTGIKRRLWNRDQATVLNFLKILNSLRKTGERPSHFTRKYPLD
ncbi:hypothetical protein G6F24_004317 [Rhizopus arrhizus]|nr:hypothetical protein G6F24_004317 [Rhizopus arrhizus]